MHSRLPNINLDLFNELVSEIYEAALAPELWADVLAHISNSLKTRSAILRAQDISSNQVGTYIMHNLDPAYQQQYRAHFVHIDTLIPTIAEKPVGKVEQTNSMMDEEFFKGEFYNDFALPQGMKCTAGAVLLRRNSWLAVMGFHRNHRRGDFSEQEIMLFEKLIPHLQRSLKLNQKLWQANERYHASSRVLDELALGVILVDTAGKPLFLNRCAETCVNQGRALSLSKNTLRTSNSHDTQALHKLIFDATRSTLPQAGALALSTSEGHMLSVMVTPVSQELSTRFQIGDSMVAAAIFISSHEAQELSQEILCCLFSLTPAEARLAAALANGDSLECMAQRFGVSLNTVRTQLKSCFRKTGTSRQNELVKLVLSAPAAWLNSSQQ